MPTMSQESVKVLPMQSRSAMSLDEIQAAMSKAPPNKSGLRSGWASMNNHQSNIGVIGGVPPVSMPTLEPATEVLPEMLRARFYFWTAPPAGMSALPNYKPELSRKLAAIDVTITQLNKDHIGILLSTRTRPLLQQRFGVLASLERILKSRDTTISIDRHKSHMELQDADIFLWLTVQCRDRPQLSPDLLLDEVSGISGRDVSSRTADLRSGIDFDRPNFLTAVAEADTLGPIDIAFVQHVDDENRSFQVRLHIDGGFEIRKNELHFPDILDGEDLMLNATLLLAYSLVPRLNELYILDGTDWAHRRIEVIKRAMNDLEQRYSRARTALLERLQNSPGTA
ncbi:hypothetical protein NNX39_15395 [Arthrobacter sp. zg-Y826]|uniref:hypothetical protein n=1 Tax=Arthrobacter jinronghuae TaxID=2964609 RepID=UPI002101E6F1|nr:hypothetical protein [Arthrobacter jinronghuae]MCQ1957879.1 hypothetical protein [Arthrobacter jinronghuae]